MEIKPHARENFPHMQQRGIPTKNKLDRGLCFKISRFKKQIKKTGPHKHDTYYELIFLQEGEGFHCIEGEKYIISVPEVYCLKPGQLHFWQFTSVPKGFVILFNDFYFDNVSEGPIVDLYKKVVEHRRIHLPKGTFPDSILEEIFSEYNSPPRFSKVIIHGFLMALFGRLMSLVEKNATPAKVQFSTFDKFQSLLVNECPRLHKVNDYAALLHITPKYLNAICRKYADSGARQMIFARILLEAKRQLIHTDQTINEVADILSFSDASHFVKFFRKAEGLTPRQFREKYDII